jgi:orotidine-5'-phosphate decarboxylase
VPLYVAVARRVGAWSASGVQVGLVVGATAPTELRAIRQAAPALPFLVPGAGAQGGDVDAVLADGPVKDDERGGALLVNISRGIASAALEGGDPAESLRAASERWARILQC